MHVGTSEQHADMHHASTAQHTDNARSRDSASSVPMVARFSKIESLLILITVDHRSETANAQSAGEH